MAIGRLDAPTLEAFCSVLGDTGSGLRDRHAPALLR
jgi:hypothetical protein